jgi:four helix bundle protein
MSIALKEAYETRYWLRLVRDSGLAPVVSMAPLFAQTEELIRLLVAITMTSKARR